jgi:hypothetical protein
MNKTKCYMCHGEIEESVYTYQFPVETRSAYKTVCLDCFKWYKERTQNGYDKSRIIGCLAGVKA